MTALTRGPYQLLPPLSDELYAALYDDIKGAGIRVPIDVDEQGNILDGHHRKHIADELGIECPERVVRGLEEFAKVDYALTVNMARRHLSRDERKALAVTSLRRDPRLSDREHARRCGVSHPFVAGLRLAMQEAEQIDPVESRKRRGGGSYPTDRAPRLETASNLDADEAATTDRVDPVVASPDAPANAPGPADSSSAGATGAGPAPAPVADTPPKWDPEERKAHEEQVQLRKDVESARAYAPKLVTNVRAAVLTVLTGYRLGERDLVTAEQIAECRAVLDLLEKEVLADAQR